MVLNKPWILVPIDVTEAKITTEISPAMRPYSIAVTPDWSFRNRTNNFFICLSVDVDPLKCGEATFRAAVIKIRVALGATCIANSAPCA
jgi:hypothetical protein